MQIKTTTTNQYHLTPTRMPNVKKKQKITTVGEDVAKLEHIFCW